MGLDLVFHHLPSVGPKQLCVLAHLGCTGAANTSQSTNHFNMYTANNFIIHTKLDKNIMCFLSNIPDVVYYELLYFVLVIKVTYNDSL